MVPASLARLGVHAEIVDSNGLLPLSSTPRPFTRAYDFRRFLQRTFPGFLDRSPLADPLGHYELPPPPALPAEILERWPAAVAGLLAAKPALLATLPIDHEVRAVDLPGGSQAGTGILTRFIEEGLQAYVEKRNDPDEDGGSGLSPYLHFGHVGAWQIFEAVTKREGWTPEVLGDDTRGARSGWWGLTAEAEAFLDQAVVWRELGYHFCHHVPEHAEYESLPDWAQVTLELHAQDPRPASYDLEQLEAAETDDPLWNAAQRQLLREGRIHNYLRMLWGKRILEWAPHPRAALEAMLYLNDRYALDGRDPNSITGITWCLGRFDRAWGPERPVFGKVRYMSSKNTARKLHVKRYLERYGDRISTP
jgi:deoxyribodipyrimidine photo-lyase